MTVYMDMTEVNMGQEHSSFDPFNTTTRFEDQSMEITVSDEEEQEEER